MSVKEIARFAEIKGLNLVGTGDFTHPRWLKELHETLVPESDTNLYKPIEIPESSVRFMLTTEVSTIFTFENKVRKVHHVILSPSLDIAAQVNERLSTFGNLSLDGRPTLNMSAPHLVEEVISVSNRNVIFPAHAWTPWFSVFGAFSGFDRMDECYQDMTKLVFHPTHP
jgi:PHP family Zn ribbon phosphoesterase